MQAAKNRVLITGADGFTGRHLAHQLQNVGYETHGLVRESTALANYSVLHVTDLIDFDRLLDTIEVVRPRYVVHLAAISFVAHGNVDEIYRVNLLGTRNLLEALAKSSCKQQAVLLASSANVYGNSVAQCLTENSVLKPANDYAVSKLAMEYMAGLFQERLPIIITRPFNYAGVGQSLSFLLPKIVSHFRARAHVLELGNLDVARDFSDVRMICDVYSRLLETPEAVGGIFNVCSGKGHTLQQVLQMVSEITGHALDVKINPAFVRSNEVKTLVGSRQELERVIGPVNSIPLYDTLRWMIEEEN